MEKLTKTQADKMIQAANEKKFWVHLRGEGKALGIETHNYMVYWFEVDEDGKLWFTHTYNTNSGRYSEGQRRGINFLFKMVY